MKDKQRRPWLSVIIGSESLVSHAGGALLVETARRSGLAGQLWTRLGPWRRPLAIHDPGKVVVDLAVAVALGGDGACDVAVLRAAPGVFGPVASDPTVSRLIACLAQDADGALGAITGARAAARERVWEWAGAPIQDGQVVLDLDATLITAHADKEDATRTWKKTFGFHPLLGFADHGTGGAGEPVAELLRPGKAGSNTAARSRRGVRLRPGAAARVAAPPGWAGSGGGAGPHRRRRRDERVRCEAGYGRIVNMSSTLGSLHHMDRPTEPAYRVTKAALNALTRVLEW